MSAASESGTVFIQGDLYALADELLAALDAGGFAVVPKEPTPEMLTAMHDAWDYFDANSDVFRREYKAAVAASNPKEEGK